MELITITVKVQIVISDTDKVFLDETMSAYRDACTQNYFSVNTLNGRIKLLYFAKGMSKYFLHIPVTYDVEESNISDICNVIGIDRGINFVVATSAVLFVDILKSLIVIREYICLFAKTVVTNRMMTVLEL